MAREYLFVYGTLGPGRPNAHVMERIGGQWQKASVRGRLVDAGWGAEQGYPASRLEDVGEQVEGYLFSSENLHAHWLGLDAFEGSEYERVETTAVLEDGSAISAQIYVLKE